MEPSIGQMEATQPKKVLSGGAGSFAPPPDFLIEAKVPWGRIAWFFGMALTCFLLYCGHIASGPDYTLGFDRQVESRLPESRLVDAFMKVTDWPSWFSAVVKAQVIDASDHPLPASQQIASKGAMILLRVDSGRGLEKPFDLMLQVTRIIPGRMLELRVLDDSSGRLFHYFDSILWRLDLQQEDDGRTRILGNESVRTANWRSRIFGRIAGRIMMSQIFYPDLIKLADPVQARVNDIGK